MDLRKIILSDYGYQPPNPSMNIPETIFIIIFHVVACTFLFLWLGLALNARTFAYRKAIGCKRQRFQALADG